MPNVPNDEQTVLDASSIDNNRISTANRHNNKPNNNSCSPPTSPAYSVNNSNHWNHSLSQQSPTTMENIPWYQHGNKRSFVTIAILCFINLINYMDRLTIAGVLPSVNKFYQLTNTQAGLLQTAFVVSYMIFAPIFGYLGDRYNRKNIMIFGVLFWSGTTLAGSFIPADHYWLFLLLRALVGVGEASYSTVAPTIIADLFTHSMRTKMVAAFYFAIPVGSGLGYIVGSAVADIFDDWKWALRVTPCLGVLAVLMMIFIVQEPTRGQSEGGTGLERNTILSDLQSLARNRSFLWSTLGFTCVTFATGCLAWWAPTFMTFALELQYGIADETSVGLKFGIITCAAGFVGITLGTIGSHYLRRYSQAADPLICATGVILCVPLLYLGCLIPHKHENLAWTLFFFGEMFLCLNWAIVADMLLYVVIPTRRAMAGAIQILLSHTLGDAFSPYLIGAVSDAYIKGKPVTVETSYLGLQYAQFIACFVLILGGACFLITSFYIVEDKEKCKKIVCGDDSLFSQNQYLPNPVSLSVEEDMAWSYTDTHHLVT